MADISASPLITSPPTSLTDLVSAYDKCLRAILDLHAPIQTSVVTVRPESKWFNKEVEKAKTELRRLESAMKRSGLTVHAQIFEEAVKDYHKLRTRTKRAYYTNLIMDAAGDQGALFGIMDQLLQ